MLAYSDWERVIIIHSKDTASNTWALSRALLSAHSGYHDLAWVDIQNTLTTDEVNAGDAINPNGVQGNDHPKVYVSWSKHANFDTRNTGWNDPISQSTDNAFRSEDWWHFVDAQYYVRSTLVPPLIKAFADIQTSDRSVQITPPPQAKPWAQWIGAVLVATLHRFKKLFVPSKP